MDKSFIKKAIEIVNNMDFLKYKNYIDNVKYVIFLISKILITYKINSLQFNEDNCQKTLNIGSKHNGVKFLKKYEHYDLGDISVQEQICNLVASYSPIIDLTEYVPAVLYEVMLTSKEKKSLGQVYTPKDIIDEMLSTAFKHGEITLNTKILDPACGGGYFLIEAFKLLRDDSAFQHMSIEDRETYIIENVIYGADIDEFSVFMTQVGILFNSNIGSVNMNIYQKDFLMDFDNSKLRFDIIIGNPPYIGHKQLNKEYRALLKEKYNCVFYDKADISYCFFKASKDLLKKKGIISFITSRYFMEAMYADRLRKYLQNELNIISIIDYNGKKIFKGIMVSPVIINLSNNTNNSNNVLSKNTFSYSKYNTVTSDFDSCKYDTDKLNNGAWIILNSREAELYNRINKLSNTYIKDLCQIRQGIITGLDKAFIVTQKEIEEYNIETELLKKWIKNSNISRTGVEYKGLYIIYSNLIQNENDYPNAVNYIKQYKSNLLKRRECEKNIRKWYELQWGRIPDDFHEPKIIFPFKASGNNFFYDKNGYFCSADIYIMKDIRSDISFEFLEKYLNSSVFEFYFKCEAKKVGENLYEYYPNKLKNMKIFIESESYIKNISNLSKFSIEKYLKKVFNISGDDEEIINKYILQG